MPKKIKLIFFSFLFCYFLAGFFNIVFATPSISVAFPNGGENFEVGKSYNISWNASGLDKTSKIRVFVCNDQETPLCVYSIINKGVLLPISQTSLDWVLVPELFEMAGISEGDAFKIQVSEILPNSSTGAWDRSDDFFDISESLFNVDIKPTIQNGSGSAGLLISVENKETGIVSTCLSSNNSCLLRLPFGNYKAYTQSIKNPSFDCVLPNCPLDFQVIDKDVVLQLKINFIIPQADYCSDTDANENSHYVKGAVRFYKKGNPTMIGMVDSCLKNNTTLREYSCFAGLYATEDYVCPQGCYNGVCSQNCVSLFGDGYQCRVANQIWIFREQCPDKKIEQKQLDSGLFCDKLGGNYCVSCFQEQTPGCSLDSECLGKESCDSGWEPYCSINKQCSCKQKPIEPPVVGECSKCGAGVFNTCDAKECLNLGDCVFEKGALSGSCVAKCQKDADCASKECDSSQEPYCAIGGKCACKAVTPPVIPPGGSQCSKCGEGVFNICDEQECSFLGDCVFIKGFIGGKCDSKCYGDENCSNCGSGFIRKCEISSGKCSCQAVEPPKPEPVIVDCEDEYGAGFWCGDFTDWQGQCDSSGERNKINGECNSEGNQYCIKCSVKPQPEPVIVDCEDEYGTGFWCGDSADWQGQCDSSGERNKISGDCNKQGDNYCIKCAVKPPSCACSDNYTPVCGTDGNTYGNVCKAGCAKIAISYQGECLVPPVTPPISCVDSDKGGDAYYVLGATKGLGDDQKISTFKDYCSSQDSSTLYEYYCWDTTAAKEEVKCGYGCSNGACNRGFPPVALGDIVASQGGTVKSSVGNINVALEAPKNAFPGNVNVKISPLDLGSAEFQQKVAFLMSKLNRRIINGSAFDFTVTMNGQELHNFDKPLTLRIGYDKQYVSDEEEKSLAICLFNRETGQWEVLPTKVDITNRALTAQTSHFIPVLIGAVAQADVTFGGMGKKIEDIIAAVNKYLFTLILILAPLMILVGGFMMLMSRGDPTKFTKAKSVVIWAAIGFGLALFAKIIYSIVRYLITGGA